jgi:ferredoxin
MSFKITVDLNECKGYAACLIESSELFDIDPATDKAIVKGGPLHDDGFRAKADAAARACPARAIQVEDA